MKKTRNLIIYTIVLVCYGFLLMQELSWNEMEEEFNSNVNAEMRLDLDGDGVFDLDLEDDENSPSSTQHSKKTVDQLPLGLFVEAVSHLSINKGEVVLFLKPQDVFSKIFTPPKA